MNELEFDKTDTNWNQSISAEDIFMRTFDLAHLVLKHDHPILNELRPILFGKYLVVMKFTSKGVSSGICINGQTKVYRNSKSSPVCFSKGVRLLEGTPTPWGGSNQYPVPSFKEGYCVIEFTTNGLPMTDKYSGWKSELITLKRI